MGHLNSLLTDNTAAGKDVLLATSCLLTLLYRHITPELINKHAIQQGTYLTDPSRLPLEMVLEDI